MALAASLLTAESVYLHDLPRTSDTSLLLRLIQGLGADVEELSPNSVRVNAAGIDPAKMETSEFNDLFGRARMPLNLVGALAGRLGVARVPVPGGDRIGSRKIDTLLNGLRDAGYDVIHERPGWGHTIRSGEERGCCSILLEEASVTGTACVLLASSTRKTTTEVFNAACDPDVVQLCRMLLAMGVGISGVGSNRLVIEGSAALRGCEHRLAPDIMEIGGLIALAGATRSQLEVTASSGVMVEPITRVFKQMGVEAAWAANVLKITPAEVPAVLTGSDGPPLRVSDATWPGFPTDVLCPAIVTATTCQGAVLFHERMYEQRLGFVHQLNGMGARVTMCDPHRALVLGMGAGGRLRGGRLQAEDIRGGMALLIAALAADGISEVRGVEHLDRGYESLEARLTQLGACIVRLPTLN